MPEVIPGNVFELIAEGFSGGNFGGIPRENTRFLIEEIAGRISDGILVVISWKGFHEQSL